MGHKKLYDKDMLTLTRLGSCITPRARGGKLWIWDIRILVMFLYHFHLHIFKKFKIEENV